MAKGKKPNTAIERPPYVPRTISVDLTWNQIERLLRLTYKAGHDDSLGPLRLEYEEIHGLLNAAWRRKD